MHNPVLRFLAEHGVDVALVKRLPNDEKVPYLVNHFFTDQELDRFAERRSVPKRSKDLGLVVIKPELAAHVDEVQLYLSGLGIESQRLPTHYLTKEEWLSMYGYKVRYAPDIINLYITQCAMGMTPILFQHLTTESYRTLRPTFSTELDMEDPDAVFDGIFCGSTSIASPGTLRWDIARNRMSQVGFDTMTGFAAQFDAYDYYRLGPLNDVYLFFTGFHVPSNGGECQANLEIFVKS